MSDKNIEAIYQLSPTQQGILFHTLYAPQSRAYFSQISCAFNDDLNIAAFERAWQCTMNRHAVLRSAFVWEDFNEPLQVVGRNVKLRLAKSEWRELSVEQQQEQLAARLHEDRTRGFQLSKAPLMRLSVIRTGERAYQFIWSFHHLLLDGWSQAIIIKEVFTLYAAYSQGKEIELEEPRPYRDYIQWLQQQDVGKAEHYWREQLKGMTAPTTLGIELSSSAVTPNKHDFAQQQIKLSPEATIGLKQFAREQQLTLNTVIQGAWGLLLSRYSGEQDVAFGAVVSGRPTALAGFDKMVGLFINTLPARMRIVNEQSVGGWLKELQASQVRMRQYEYSSLVQVQGWSELPRGLPLFESILDFENYPMDRALQQWGASLEYADTDFVVRTNYPLEVVAVPGAELSLQMKYDCQRFDSATIFQMLGNFKTLLEAFIGNADRPLSCLPMLTQAEGKMLLTEWNRTGVDWPADGLIHHIFEKQAALTPEAVAVVCGADSLTYGQLNARANSLARALIEKGAGTETVVALLMERNISLLVSMLAVFKAGAAYAPLDPFHPASRLRQAIEQSRSTILLTSQKFEPACKEAIAGLATNLHPAVFVTEDLINQEQPQENPEASVAPGNLAYIIFTSGSTGLPKGAMIEHRGMLNHLYAKISELRLTAKDVVGQTASQCFDISVWQFLAPLLIGGSVHIFSDEVIADPRLFFAQVEQGAVSILETVPSLLRATLDEEVIAHSRAQQMPALRWLLMTGEALSPDLCRQWFKIYPQIPLLNAYGPTECSDDVTHYAICCAPPEDKVRMPIGRPIANTQAYILDSNLRAVPVGVSGELYIGGRGVGRGYVNNASRTAVAFVPDLFASEPGARLYRTGDLARYLPCGNIEFLGRIDSQVKIRGFRIELGEIESALGKHPGIREAVAVAYEGAMHDKRLVAYVVAQAKPPTTIELRNFLKESLPEYMLPEAFIMMEALPLTANGKLNLSALPPPDTQRPLQSQPFVAPRTPTAQTLARLWKDVLNIERVGILDNFFDLGGHSLLAIKLVARIRTEFNVEMALADFFTAATIEELSKKVEEALIDTSNFAEMEEMLGMLESVEENEATRMLAHDDALKAD
jgi:amino acid adenylation domain-containing protein